MLAGRDHPRRERLAVVQRLDDRRHLDHLGSGPDHDRHGSTGHDILLCASPERSALPSKLGYSCAVLHQRSGLPVTAWTVYCRIARRVAASPIRLATISRGALTSAWPAPYNRPTNRIFIAVRHTSSTRLTAISHHTAVNGTTIDAMSAEVSASRTVVSANSRYAPTSSRLVAIALRSRHRQ